MVDYNTPYLRKNMCKGVFGLEKEGLRVTADGKIAGTPHQFGDSEKITRDFSEAQLEFVTSIHNSPEGAVNELKDLHKFAYKKLSALKSGKEFIWCFSNPPVIDDEESINVAHFKGNLQGKEVYREYLAEKYGKKKMLLSGIHFNFSFPNDLIQKMFDNSSEENYRNFKDNLYLDVAGKLLDYSWLIVILTAASPVFDSSFVGESAGKTLHNGYGSVRCSKDGYWNTFVPYIDYTDLESYVDTIKDYVEQGLLKAESELYCPVRLKHQGVNSLDNLINNGVNHLEFRLLDVNPLYEVGVNPIDIKFIHLVIIYLSAQNNLSLSREVQKQAYDNIKASAMFDITSFVPKAKVILSEMKNFFGEDIPKDYKESLDFQMNKLDDKNSRYTYKILQQYGNDFIGKGVITAAKNSELRG